MQTMRSQIRIQTACLVILSVVAVGWALYVLSPVLIPFVLAVFFTHALLPVIDFQTQVMRMPRLLALLLTGLLAFLLLALFALLITFTINQMTANIDIYQAQLGDLVDWVIGKLPLEKFGMDPEAVKTSLFQVPQKEIARLLSSTFGAIMNIVSNGTIVLIFVAFMLMGKHAGLRAPGGLTADIQEQVKQYSLSMLFVSTLTAVLVALSLHLLGVPFALMFGFFAFLLNFIPYIGSIIATLLPVPVIFLAPELSMTAKIMAVAIPGTIQFVMGNIVAPKIMGDYLELHPVVVLISLMFFGMIWGIVGMFLAAPITAVLKIAFQRTEYTRPIADLFDGRLDLFDRGRDAAPPG